MAREFFEQILLIGSVFIASFYHYLHATILAELLISYQYGTLVLCLFKNFSDAVCQEKIWCTSHNALLSMGYFVQEVMRGDNDHIP